MEERSEKEKRVQNNWWREKSNRNWKVEGVFVCYCRRGEFELGQRSRIVGLSS